MESDLNLCIYHVATAGTLSCLIPKENLCTVKRLKLTGYLNGDDLRLLRYMAGKDDDADTDGQLEELDLSEVHIVKGGGCYLYQIFSSESDVLGDRVFMSCRKLKSIRIPRGVRQIGHLAFSGTMIEDVCIPEGVESLGHAAFYGCSALVNISLPHSMKEMGSSVFSGCPNLASIAVPECMGCLPVDFVSGSGIKSITIPEGVSEIRKGAFSLCCNLEVVYLPSTIEVIGKGAFDMCFSMKELHMKSTQAPSVHEQTFVEKDVNDTTFSFTNCKLYVPQGSNYRDKETWNKFTTVIEE